MEKSCCLAFWNTLNGSISIRGTLWLYRFIYHCERFEPSSHFISVKQDRPRECRTRGGSRGRVQGVCTLPWDYLRFSNTTGILQKNYVVYWCWSRARDECTPSQKKSWIRPWELFVTVTDVSTTCAVFNFSVKVSCITSVMVLYCGYWPDWSIQSRCYWSSVR